MVEPDERPVRPTGMRTSVTPLARLGAVGLLAALAACGSPAQDGAAGSGTGSEGGSPSASASAPPRTVGGCAPDDPALRGATRLTRADLDGDGSAEQVRLTAADAAVCPSVIFARAGAGYLSAEAPDGPPVVAASAARLPGRDADLLVTEQRHPRGGTQTRLWAATPEGLAELQDPDGNAVVPFRATDTPPAPVAVTCTEDGLAVTEAVAHEPAGVMFTWDVRRTTYAVADGRAERTGRREVADNVLPAQLRARFPELARSEVLAGCRR